MKSSSFTRFGLVGIFPILAVVLLAAFFLRSPNSMVVSGATTHNDTQNVSLVEEPQRNAPPPAAASRDNYSFHFARGSEPSKPVIPVTARNAQDTSNQPSPAEQPIYLEGGYWLETGWDGNWRAHR